REGGVVEDEPGGSRRVIGGGPREGKVRGGNAPPTSRRGTDCRVCDEPADVVSRVVTFGRIGDDHLDAAADDRGRESLGEAEEEGCLAGDKRFVEAGVRARAEDLSGKRARPFQNRPR